MSQTPIGRMIDASVHCAKCGAKGMGNCDCQQRCACGWWAEEGKPCRNPKTILCSSKLSYYGGIRAAKKAAKAKWKKARR